MASPHPFRLPLPARLATYGALIVWSAFCLFPLYWIAVNSIKTGDGVMSGPYYLPYLDFAPSLDGWRFILTNAQGSLAPKFANSAIVAVCATFLCLLLGSLFAYGVTRFGTSERSGNLLIVAVLVTRLLPPMVLVLPLYFMAMYTHTLDTRLALIVIYTAINLPVAVWLLRPVFGAQASEQEESATLDGASRLRVFIEIAVPMAAAGIAASGLIIFVLCWNEYLIAASLAGDRAMTVPPWMIGQLSIKEAQIGGDEEEWVNLSAATLLMVAPLVLFASLVHRVLTRAVLSVR